MKKTVNNKESKCIREALGLCQEAFAELCGVKQSLISRWEKEGPTLQENIQKLIVLREEIESPKNLKKLKRLIEEEGPGTVAPLLKFAGKGMGSRGVEAALAVGAVSGAGLFGKGLLALGGALGTYQLLKSVFDPEPDDSTEDES